MVRYLYLHQQMDPNETTAHDRAGTLSHLLLLRLACWEDALGKINQKLPPLSDPRPAQPNQPKLTDAEAITAFSQEQRRRIKRERLVGSTGKRGRAGTPGPSTNVHGQQEVSTKRRRLESRKDMRRVPTILLDSEDFKGASTQHIRGSDPQPESKREFAPAQNTLIQQQTARVSERNFPLQNEPTPRVGPARMTMGGGQRTVRYAKQAQPRLFQGKVGNAPEVPRTQP